jgi:hypothetical protein
LIPGAAIRLRAANNGNAHYQFPEFQLLLTL